MENLRLNFDAVIEGETRTFNLEIPYQDGMVVTSRFCPLSLLEGEVKLMGAVRGDTLDAFIENCRMHLIALSEITNVENELDRHIGALMAVVMEKLAGNRQISFADLLLCIDVFSFLLQGGGFSTSEILDIYLNVIQTILHIYPDYFDFIPESLRRASSRERTTFEA